MDLFSILKYSAGAIVGLIIGYFVGHYRGDNAGYDRAVSEQNVLAADESKKDTSNREKIDDQTRKLPESDIDLQLSANGWLRTN